ncbi:hypothetical protein NN561_000859 [Cricetulus griseus]
MGCTGGFGGSRAEEGGVRTVGGGTAKAAPRAAASAPRPPAQSGFVQSGQQPGKRRGKGEGAFTWLCRDGSQAPGSASHLAISSPPPSSTQFGPPVPKGDSANSARPRREAEPTPLPISTRFLSTDGASGQ